MLVFEEMVNMVLLRNPECKVVCVFSSELQTWSAGEEKRDQAVCFFVYTKATGADVGKGTALPMVASLASWSSGIYTLRKWEEQQLHLSLSTPD